MCPVVGLCALKSWQETVVDVDCVAPVLVAKVLAEDLHVPAHSRT